MFSFTNLRFQQWPTDASSVQAKWHFSNGYGISVIRGPKTYGGAAGLYEVAALKDGKIVPTEVTPDTVVGWLSPAEVEQVGRQIEALEVPDEG